jgi:hypothetical protein
MDWKFGDSRLRFALRTIRKVSPPVPVRRGERDSSASEVGKIDNKTNSPLNEES